MSKKLVYVAGPYTGTGPDAFSITHGYITIARLYAIKIWQAGAVAVCPHLNTMHFEVDAGLPYETYIEGDMAILDRCDAIYMLPEWEKSKGAKLEHEHARFRDLPIFHSVENIKGWLARTEREAATRQAMPQGDGVDVALLVEADIMAKKSWPASIPMDHLYHQLVSAACSIRVALLPIGQGDTRHEICKDIEARVEEGRKKYGTRLKTNNGRNVPLDLYQEILDAINYARQIIAEWAAPTYTTHTAPYVPNVGDTIRVIQGPVGDYKVEGVTNGNGLPESRFDRATKAVSTVRVDDDPYIAKETSFTYTGRPLSEIGLDKCVIVDANGKERGPIQGIVCYSGDTLVDAITRAIPEGCTLVYKGDPSGNNLGILNSSDREAAVAKETPAESRAKVDEAFKLPPKPTSPITRAVRKIFKRKPAKKTGKRSGRGK